MNEIINEIGRINIKSYPLQCYLKESDCENTLQKEMVFQNRENMTRKEVAQHNTYEDLWIIVDNKVYDLTKFAPTHPGGGAAIGFYGIQHLERAFVELEDYLVGTLSQEVSKHNNIRDC